METYKLTPQEEKRRRRRNIALALFLGFLSVMFFVTTMVRLSANLSQ